MGQWIMWMKAVQFSAKVRFLFAWQIISKFECRDFDSRQEEFSFWDIPQWLRPRMANFLLSLLQYLVDTPLLGSKYSCMYQFLHRNTQKSYFGDNTTVYNKNTAPHTTVSAYQEKLDKELTKYMAKCWSDA